ncbi:cobalt-precorrin-7 (C(5))-methyltransferase [Methanobacterium paludis]|uniref:Precorrin-6y C5,15-methyltransferase (Decarboxylating), CbiE subunit n=1 Tax=Methanobacterium paludis (strain DSM 25820 / JCM 18151 / SWAN1) TaxID=868131 RepID=F6D7P1_METPW|nr:cobalt-precorrin-7 (C(5))-methyltransferase [Methanobacterium paludis]AEG17120.1 precorrin-6y C5,15-methyltransferase (decarboxylating), CbiE subunit [Methanobacterium paludis]
MSKIYVVGIGPGSSEYLTVKAQKIVESADILMGSRRSLELFKDVDEEKIEIEAREMEEMMKLAVSHVGKGKSVALLSTGDPGFSGVLKLILKLMDDLNGEIDVEVVPGVSSIQMCAAKLQIPWDDADIVTMHGKGNSKDVLKLVDNGKPTIILPNRSVEELAEFLIDNGVDPAREIAVCEKLSYPDEKIVKTSLNEVLGMKFSYMCVVVVY